MNIITNITYIILLLWILRVEFYLRDIKKPIPVHFFRKYGNYKMAITEPIEITIQDTLDHISEIDKTIKHIITGMKVLGLEEKHVIINKMYWEKVKKDAK